MLLESRTFFFKIISFYKLKHFLIYIDFFITFKINIFLTNVHTYINHVIKNQKIILRDIILPSKKLNNLNNYLFQRIF